MVYLRILEELERLQKTNEKLALLEEHKDNLNLKDYLQIALDDRITFGVAKIKDIAFADTDNFTVRDGDGTFESFRRLVSLLYHRELTGNNAHKTINWFLEGCNDLEKKWFRKCIQKDLASCKVGASLVNRVWPLLALDFKCMLAEKEEKLEKVDFSQGAGAELKGNGIRTFWPLDSEGKVTSTKWYPNYKGPIGRSGMPLPQFMFMLPHIEAVGWADQMIDTEVHCKHCLPNIQTIMQFEPAIIGDFTNDKGKVSKKWDDYLIKEKEVAILREDVTINIIDVLTKEEWEAEECERDYEERRLYLDSLDVHLCETFGTVRKIYTMPWERVDSYAEAVAVAQKWIDMKLEGAIIKPFRGKYRWTRHYDWTKVKEEVEEDVLIIGYEVAEQTYGVNGVANPPILGKFLVIDSEGRKFGVGTGIGWTFEFYREALEHIEDFHHRVMKITAQSFTSKAAICPRFDCFRDDKTARDIIGD
jgi:hypothetical protein